MNTPQHLSSQLADRDAQVQRGLRAYQSLEYDPATTVLSIVTENLAPSRINEALEEVARKRGGKSAQRMDQSDDNLPIDLLRRLPS
ncbi:MAG: hypothetical protein U0175_06570 [Caldilineaceae bacterium]